MGPAEAIGAQDHKLARSDAAIWGQSLPKLDAISAISSQKTLYCPAEGIAALWICSVGHARLLCRH